ncbi:YncE family protein [Bacillus pumilus]|uniref:YncE family protein n=1 Tax=Bacillus pumilus TaxID=1408 RepID=UPI00124976F3|nr:YncE family protein [Bacillus pumilus]
MTDNPTVIIDILYKKCLYFNCKKIHAKGVVRLKKLGYVTNTDSNDISVIDINTNVEIGRIPVGGSPRGGMAIENNGEFGFVSNCAGNTVSVIDIKNSKEVTKITVGLAPRGVVISPDNSLLFVSNSGSNDVSIVDLTTKEEITKVPVGNNPRALSITPSGEYVNIPCWGEDALSVIKVNYDQPENSYETTRITLGEFRRPYHAFSDADNTHVYTANTHGHSVSIVNILDEVIEAEVKVGYGPRAVISDSKQPYLYVSCEASNVVSVINKHTWKEEKQIDAGLTPRGLKLDEENGTIYVSNFSRTFPTTSSPIMNSLSVIDLKEQKQIGTIKTGLGPCSINIFDPVKLKVESVVDTEVKATN